MERNDVFREIDNEREYQERKWGTIEQHPLTVGEYLLILKGELDEATQAWRKSRGDTDALDEIRQVAAVAVAALEEHGCPSRQN